MTEREKQLQQELGDDIEIIDGLDYKPWRIPALTWHEYVKKICEVDIVIPYHLSNWRNTHVFYGK